MRVQTELKLPRLLTWKQLKSELGITFSREHLWRLEAASKFPKRIYLSPQKVAWFEDEILAWLAERAAERHTRHYRDHG
jgi:prophage regulatory protein